MAVESLLCLHTQAWNTVQFEMSHGSFLRTLLGSPACAYSLTPYCNHTLLAECPRSVPLTAVLRRPPLFLQIGKFGAVELSDVEAFVEMPDGKVLSSTETGEMLMWDGGLIKVGCALAGL